MSKLKVSMLGFNIDPAFHPKYGAWGTTPVITETDMPLLTRCLVLEQEGRLLVWFGHDLCGDTVPGTDLLRKEVAEALGIECEQVVWSTSQTHSSPALPGSSLPGGSSITAHGSFDEEFCNQERRRFINSCIDTAKEAIRSLRPARVWFGKGYCDNIGYNSRFPMPTGGVKFSRDYGEGVQGGKYFDPTVGMVRFDDMDGKAIGVIFNFNCHPATMINDKYLSSDFVGTARKYIEEESEGAPAMFIQGFCGDIHCYYMFCGPEQARITGARLGKAAIGAMQTMTPVRSTPMLYAWNTIELPCREMFTREELLHEIEIRKAFQKELDSYPKACWVGGVNVPEFFNVEQKKAFVDVNIRYCEEGLRILESGNTPKSHLTIELGVLRIGDVYASMSPGENFAVTGKEIRERFLSPNILICGDTNGLFGYIGNDEEIDRGGYETDTFWKMLYFEGFRLPLAKGSAQILIHASINLLNQLQNAEEV